MSTLIIGVTNSFSLKYATNIAFNSGINIIDTILFQNIEEYSLPSDLIDVVIIVGGVDSHGGLFPRACITTWRNSTTPIGVCRQSTQDAPLMRKASTMWWCCPILSMTGCISWKST